MKQKFTLNNGQTIPSIGFGTWQTPDGITAINAINCAIEYGYRHIDTAAIYGNEKSIGQAIQENEIDRSEIFITSKLWNSNRGYESTLMAFEKTMTDLRLDYLDLYLIHWPANANQFANWKEINSKTWKAFEFLYKEGRIKSIGLSNFLVHHIEALLDTASIKPSINQIEYHPGFKQQDVVDFCRKNEILVQAWAPLGRGKMLNNKELIEIASKYDVSVAQLCIRWILQNGILPLPKSVTPSRIRENIQVDHFEILPNDMEFINSMDYFGGSGLHPDTVSF